MKSQERKNREAIEKAAQAEILLTQDAGYIHKVSLVEKLNYMN